jgi:hypothetical protein
LNARKSNGEGCILETDAKIDWLAFTIKSEFIPPELLSVTGIFEETGHGTNNYRKSSKSNSGALLLSDGTQDMGLHVIMSGSSLEKLRDDGIHDREICQLVCTVNGKTSRLDLALDILNGRTTVQ